MLLQLRLELVLPLDHGPSFSRISQFNAGFCMLAGLLLHRTLPLPNGGLVGSPTTSLDALVFPAQGRLARYLCAPGNRTELERPADGLLAGPGRLPLYTALPGGQPQSLCPPAGGDSGVARCCAPTRNPLHLHANVVPALLRVNHVHCYHFPYHRTKSFIVDR